MNHQNYFFPVCDLRPTDRGTEKGKPFSSLSCVCATVPATLCFVTIDWIDILFLCRNIQYYRVILEVPQSSNFHLDELHLLQDLAITELGFLE